MSTHGPINGIDIVRHMQPKGDLEGKWLMFDQWLMFDHYKHVQHWTTMGCYVCNPLYYQILTIAICDMQSKDVDSQMLMWNSLYTFINGWCNLTKNLFFYHVTMVTSFKHLSNNLGIGITSREEVKDMVRTTMSYVYNQQVNKEIHVRL